MNKILLTIICAAFALCACPADESNSPVTYGEYTVVWYAKVYGLAYGGLGHDAGEINFPALPSAGDVYSAELADYTCTFDVRGTGDAESKLTLFCRHKQTEQETIAEFQCKGENLSPTKKSQEGGFYLPQSGSWWYLQIGCQLIGSNPG